MKKKPPRKLTLNRESLRNLASDSLHGIHGAAPTWGGTCYQYTCPDSCITCYATCATCGASCMC